MPPSDSQSFLRELDKKLWTAADRLRSNLDAAVYKHAVPRSGGLRTASSSSPRQANRSSPLPDTFTRDQHPDLRADFVMALPSAAARSHPRSHPADRPNGRINPPFNIKEWWDGKLEGDARWSRSEAESASHAKFYKDRGKYGTPPQTAMRECAPLKSEGTPQVVSEARDKNANFAWVQHMLHHLAPNGSMALLLANGSMSSNSSGEGDIRRALIEADLVECMVALPDLIAVDPIKVTIAHKARIVSHSPSRKEIINAN